MDKIKSVQEFIFGPDHHTHVLHEDDITDKYVQHYKYTYALRAETQMCPVLY